MTTKIEHVVWDSCVIIDAIQATPGRWEKIEPFVREAQAGRLQIVISEVNVAEILRLRRLGDGGMSIEDQVNLITRWLQNPYIVRRPVLKNVAELAAKIGRKYDIKGAADCIIVATALTEKIGKIHSFDGDNEKPSARKLLNFDGKIGTPALRITVPDASVGTIFEKTRSDDKKATA